MIGGRAHRWVATGGLALAALAGATLAQEGGERAIPRRLSALVLGARQRAIHRVALDGQEFLCLRVFSDDPFVLWPALPADAAAPATPVGKDPGGVRDWLARSHAVLGHRGLELAYRETREWLGGETWIYSVRHAGLEIFDAEVQVHWDGAQLVGVCNQVPLPIASMEEPDLPLDPARRWVYHASPSIPPGRSRALELAWLEEEVQPFGLETRVVSRRGTLRTIRAPAPLSAGAAPQATFREFAVPVGSFPDQIDVDQSGQVWFSQPSNGLVTRFDPATAKFRQHSTGNTSPDGLWIDPFDRLWTGLYSSGAGLGRLDIASLAFSAYAPPYAGANMAIPVYSRSSRIFVTDHALNRLSQFDPLGLAWISSEVMPTPGCWVVQGSEDLESRTLYFTEYNANQLGQKPWDQPVADIQLSTTGGPAFDVVHRGRVYFSQWNQDRLGVYVIATGQVLEYAYPVAGELGGPIEKTPDGKIVVGTRSRGYVMVFDPQSQQFASYLIPTAFPGLKDGLTVDAEGDVWFTESGVNKIAELDLP